MNNVENFSNEEVIVQEVDDFVVVNENGLIHVFDKEENEFLLVKGIEDECDLPHNAFLQFLKTEEAESFLNENEDYFIVNAELHKVIQSMLHKGTQGQRPYLIERSAALMVIATISKKHSGKAKKVLKESSKLAFHLLRAYANRGAEGALEVIESYVNNMENIISCSGAYQNALKVLKKCKTPITNDIRGLLKTEKAKSEKRGTSLTAEENIEYNALKVEKLESEIEELAAILKPQLE